MAIPSVALPSAAVPFSLPSGSLVDTVGRLIDLNLDGGDLIFLELGISGIPSALPSPGLPSASPSIGIPSSLPSIGLSSGMPLVAIA
jgi:hypothetical protein